MIRHFLICLLIAFSITTVACNRSKSQGSIVEPYVPDSGSVGFDISPAPDAKGASAWIATYASQGKTARFRIELGSAATPESKDTKDIPFQFGKGKFVAEPGSDASVLLADLKKALEAKSLPTKIQRVPELPFTFANFGQNLSQGSSGGFNAKPAGHWMAMKIFLEAGENEAEVFVNLNPFIGKGQFSIKDPDYGDTVLAELAKVL